MSHAHLTLRLQDVPFDPESRIWLTADAYLSGNVRQKLLVAEAAGPEYGRNAKALRSVQPEVVLPGDIDANLGAPWIPVADVQDLQAALGGNTVGKTVKASIVRGGELTEASIVVGERPGRS